MPDDFDKWLETVDPLHEIVLPSKLILMREAWDAGKASVVNGTGDSRPTLPEGVTRDSIIAYLRAVARDYRKDIAPEFPITTTPEWIIADWIEREVPVASNGLQEAAQVVFEAWRDDNTVALDVQMQNLRRALDATTPLLSDTELPGPELGPDDPLPCAVKCDGGPGFGKGVKLGALLGYLARRVTYNNDPPVTEEQKAAFKALLAEARGDDAQRDLEGTLAGLADCINQELRENGPHDDQIRDYLREDFRPFIRRLVDRVRERPVAGTAEQDARDAMGAIAFPRPGVNTSETKNGN